MAPEPDEELIARIAADIQATVARHLRAMHDELKRLPLTIPEPVSGSSRKLTRQWTRIQPGLQGRVLSFGGPGEDAWCWIDLRPERD